MSRKPFDLWLFGISRGRGSGFPNLLGVAGKEPEQVWDSNALTTQTPRDSDLFLCGEIQSFFFQQSVIYP